jgi:hypothetical protein
MRHKKRLTARVPVVLIQIGYSQMAQRAIQTLKKPAYVHKTTPPEASNITSTNVARVNPWGVKESIAGSAEVVSELLSMNTSIFNALKSFNHTAGTSGNVINDPRENHYVSGATWGDNGVIPTYFQSNTEGSPYLANSTMETFVQDTGCFGCHSAVLFKTNKKINDLSTSHIFTTIKSVLKK